MTADEIGCGRRTLLKTVGVAAGAGPLAIATGRASATGGHTLSIEGQGVRAEYTFVVDSDLAAESGLSSEDSIANNRAKGAVRSGRDTYTFDGDLVAFAIDGPINVLLDGEPARVGQRPDHVLTIDGTGEYASYTFAVTGTVVEGTGTSSEDTFDATTATGAVRAGSDSYGFTGTLDSLSLDGDADLRLDSVPRSADAVGRSGTDSGPTPPTLGAYFGTPVDGSDPSAQYESWIGREVKQGTIYVNKQSYYSGPAWLMDPWSDWVSSVSGRNISVATHVYEWTTLQEAANGSADDEYRSLVKSLIDNGLDDVTFRISYEYNLHLDPRTEQEKQWFYDYFQRTADIIHNTPGSNMKVVLNPDFGVYDGDGLPPSELYPGDSYVDYLGLDIYDVYYGGYPSGGTISRQQHIDAWNNYFEPILDDFKSFADTHNKPICIPEWGVWEHSSGEVGGHGGGDDPYFIEGMHDWMKNNSVKWQIYFGVLHKHELYGPDTQFPEASRRFKQLFG